MSTLRSELSGLQPSICTSISVLRRLDASCSPATQTLFRCRQQAPVSGKRLKGAWLPHAILLHRPSGNAGSQLILAYFMQQQPAGRSA